MTVGSSAEPRQRLLVSIHDVSPRFESEIDHLRNLLEERLGVDQLALFVIPDHWGGAPIVPGSAFATRLRQWSDRGAEIFLHGWEHRDTCQYASAIDRIKATGLTASEGEFLGLSRADALGRMRAGRHLLEGIIGRAVTGFVAPAWLYGPGAHLALTEAGFTMAEDHLRVWNPQTGQRFCSGPVLTWASRSPVRIATSLAAAATLPALLKWLPVARIGVHPGDTGEASLLRSIERSVKRMLRTHRPGRYADLQEAGRALCVS